MTEYERPQIGDFGRMRDVGRCPVLLTSDGGFLVTNACGIEKTAVLSSPYFGFTN
jgi:hypothetical protein